MQTANKLRQTETDSTASAFALLLGVGHRHRALRGLQLVLLARLLSVDLTEALDEGGLDVAAVERGGLDEGEALLLGVRPPLLGAHCARMLESVDQRSDMIKEKKKEKGGKTSEGSTSCATSSLLRTI